MSQQFHKYDWVRVAKDLGETMSHFQADCDAIVIGSYADQYGGRNHDSYTIHIERYGQTSWYYENQLTLIESGRRDKLKAWEDAEKAEVKQKSDLDWIFANGPEVCARPVGASIAALAEGLGCSNLWGSSGEGWTYDLNARATMQHAKPFLMSRDKAGWLAYLKTVVQRRSTS